jgi:hypothetical protein
MEGISDLSMILKHLHPVLHEGEYVFCSRDNLEHIELKDVLMLFQENEGVTLILESEKAKNYSILENSTFAWITLQVHSSLSTVGLTAAFSAALALEKISCNVVAAYFHDHIFVPFQDRERAMQALLTLTN